MRRMRMAALVTVLLVLVLASGCTQLAFWRPSEEQQVLRLMAKYEAAVEALDAAATMALMADDYVGPRGNGVVQFMEWLADSGDVLELDMSEATVAVDSDSATVTGVANSFGDWEGTAEYALTKTDAGWRVQGVEIDEM